MNIVHHTYGENAGKHEALFRGYTLGYFADQKQAAMALQTADSEFRCYGTLLGKRI